MMMMKLFPEEMHDFDDGDDDGNASGASFFLPFVVGDGVVLRASSSVFLFLTS